MAGEFGNLGAEGGCQIHAMHGLRSSEIDLRQQSGTRGVSILLALGDIEVRDLDLGVLLQRQLNGVLQREAQRRGIRGGAARDTCGDQQHQQRLCEHSATLRPGLAGDFIHDATGHGSGCLEKCAIAKQRREYALALVVDIQSLSKIHNKCFAISSGRFCVPSLL